ncbi:indolepyruvate ferredoxin oxidoreductase family protein [Wenxinia marina]|uniref:Indolepyruvate ferredoxin oxidoreductase, alpha and beta subunit n=1 Tax=Wenxinia marina DSM 24838 TaxID=1123501 RepID=A0A0D0Q314_9RHOB|nr:indolepyruvate ferredoxin oxidoreductase family protein [Wenxinia marina]KIQ68944.1 Indolepyruvate ferredoxin oxidoreductase, alpha and beta subunit [Wenxinia marina DSM 24838]GGL63905.1 indolepyruvate ferredoxin oxidoreductase [Wenxinia marina]
MSRQDISLHDKYDLTKSPVLLNGTQALVRLMLMQKARDRAAGLNTAGYVTGYRGSPLGAVDLSMAQARKDLTAADITFQPGLNEDLAATALWGSQQAELRGEGKYDGVFGLWYGKGPGVDRSGDVMRHANMAGTSRFGGVLMAMGDDHTGESSTVCHQSDWALVDAYMPVLSPAGVQEILDFGLYGFALSRYAGVWAGLKTMKDTVEVTSVVDGSWDRLSFVAPEDFAMPDGGLNIRLNDHWIPQEARMIDYKRFAAEAFARANRMDRRVWGKPGATIGFAAAGKNWLDLQHALSLLGIDEAGAEAMGITTYKIAQTFPLDMTSFHDWAEGLDLIVVVEEKRKLIEVQIKEAIFDDRQGRRVYGWYRGGAGGMHEEELFPTRMALDPVMIAEKIGGILIEEGRSSEHLKSALARVVEAQRSENAEEIAVRTPYFCAGCPHNTSTKLPEGSRAYAGIGCHIMSLWMDRDTSGFTHMGAEGANWVGEAPFSKRRHVFQNLGDGTYNHSGLLAIRAALAANTNITYKILYNDAVAMTGGQTNEGGLKPSRIAKELLAMGVREVALVYDPKEDFDRSSFPVEVKQHVRDEMPRVMDHMKAQDGVTAIIYVQTCAAEKRRRRKRGTFPKMDQRVWINTDVCEGCGDCGVQSNCVAIVPVETEFGRKRAVDQSSCNLDMSCLKGFCPSFVTLEGAKPRKGQGIELDLPDMPEPQLPRIHGTHNVVITGVGGTGVVTVGALLAMAAHVDGKGAGMMEMAGLAQKGGAVHIHCRIGATPQAISAIRVAAGEADTLIGGDLVVSAGTKTLGLTTTGRTRGIVNSHEIVTGDFTRNTEFRLPTERLTLALERRLRDGLTLFDASELAAKVMGDSIYANTILMGAAWQAGMLPLSGDAIREAIRLNGAAVEGNLRAFEVGRWAVAEPMAMREVLAPEAPAETSLADRIAARAAHLVRYQDDDLARRYRAFLDRIDDPRLKEAAATGYHKLLAYKDEYEVARMHLGTAERTDAAFEGTTRRVYHLSPPLLARKGADGRPKKIAVSAKWIEPAYRMLARMKGLRGTAFDPFGRTEERRMERALIAEYERDMDEVLPLARPEVMDAVVALAELPLQIRGFGPVKQANAARAAKRREELLAVIRAGGETRAAAE